MSPVIGLIGAGRIGSAVARLSLAAGFEVVVSNSRGPATLKDTVSAWGEGARAAEVSVTARAADLVVATIPLGGHRGLPAADLAGKTVIDTMNYYPERDGHIEELDDRSVTSSELVQRHLSGARVVKGFNNIDFRRLELLARPSGAPDRSALPIAGDDDGAKTAVVAFLDRLGYDAVDIGALAESWRSEPQTDVYVRPYLPDVPDGITAAADVMSWFLRCEGRPQGPEHVRRFVLGTARRSPAEAREGLG
ncbi:NAD(P)-binding domain-containing protein [Streptomyces sp. NPDC048277]|uniref:NADPH-dependent F420 reductase n=1 Tax=Streptomyces sp. NPDC048277 TaxID=3155027 RepID=UPI0033E24746